MNQSSSTPYHHIYNELHSNDPPELSSFDLKFITTTSDGETKSFNAHSLFLSFRSETMKKFLSRYQLGANRSLYEMNEIEMEEEMFDLFKSYTHMLYKSEEPERVKRYKFETFEKLSTLIERSNNDCKIWERAQYQYNYGKHLSALYESVKSNQPISTKSSDISVTIEDPTNGNEKTYHLHKLFLKRCPYIVAILKSGMIESQTSHLTFQTISIESFEKIVQYIYMNSIKLTLDSVVEIYLFSCLLEMSSLSEIALKFIKSSINEKDLACDLLTIPEFRQDSELRRICVDTIKKNTTHENAITLAFNLDLIDIADSSFLTRLASLLADQYDQIKDKYYELPRELREQIQQQLKRGIKVVKVVKK